MGHRLVSIMLGGERQSSSGCEHFILFILNHDMHAVRVAEHGLPHEECVVDWYNSIQSG